MNNAAIDLGMEAIHEVMVPERWATLEEERPADTRLLPDFIRDILEPMNRQNGDTLPVSAFIGMEDGTFPPAPPPSGETRHRPASAGLATGGLYPV